MGKKAKGPPPQVTGDKNYETWLSGLPPKSDRPTNSYDPNVELTELYGYFKGVAGKDKILSRDEFLKKFTQKVKLSSGGEELLVEDVEKLFNASGIDYDYNTVSLHEFMSLMIVIRHGDGDKKLLYSFKMHDKDGSGKLEKAEVEQMFSKLLSYISDEKKREKMVADLLKDMMEKKDLNKDGKISFDELSKAVKDEGWMKEHLGKGVETKLVVDSLFAGQKSSSMCLVM